MRIVRYQKDGHIGYGIWEGDRVRETSESPYGDWKPGAGTHRLPDVRLLPPSEPTKILCVGLNIRDHVAELRREMPKFPSHFLKPLSAIICPEDPIRIPWVAHQVDSETANRPRGEATAEVGRRDL